MVDRVAASTLPVESQPAPWWRDPEERACERAMDDLLGHDVARIARRLGMKRRRLNEQREVEHAASNWLRRLGTVVADVRSTTADPARYLPAVRLLAEAAGVRILALSEESGSDAAPLPELLGALLREVADVVDFAGRAMADGVIDQRELPEILKQIDDVLVPLQRLRESAVARALPRRGGRFVQPAATAARSATA